MPPKSKQEREIGRDRMTYLDLVTHLGLNP
jgi:hypothetical protein